ncbi:ATP-binding cassette domain-containing protein [candidate division GN15 bacterium]|nr:ATP-binding cassette domain-containing protein [candidate division GN15 bacterium]
MLSLKNVTFRYRADLPPVLDDLTLEVADGEQVCIMGANGSGKSTLARVVASLADPDSGDVHVDTPDGSPIAVGMLFQNPDNQMVAVTVDKEVVFALENLGVRPDDMQERLSDVLRRFDIEHLRRRLTSELSGGEKQRVALAALMVFDPPVLVLDEPDSFLDEAGRKLLAEQLDAIHDRSPRTSLVRITQYPHVARLYSRLIVLERGKITADGDPGMILEDEQLCRRAGLAFDPDRMTDSKTITHAITERTGNGGISRMMCQGISFSYQADQPVLTDLNFELTQGETLAVVGPSGSGKSTLGLLMCGLNKPDTGRITYFDDGGNELDAHNLSGRVSAILQQPERQFFLRTCAEEVQFGPANRGHGFTEQQTCAMMRLVGLDPEQFADRDPLTLSGGEKRRLAFAAVLSMQPDVVVFDEPTCALDVDGVARFIDLSRHLAQRARTQVIITHDGDLVRLLADRVLVLRGPDWSLVTKDEFFAGSQRSVVSPPHSAGQQTA